MTAENQVNGRSGKQPIPAYRKGKEDADGNGRKRRSTTFWVIFILVNVLGVFLLIDPVSLWHWIQKPFGETLQITPEDRAVLLTADDILNRTPQAALYGQMEGIKKRRIAGRIIQLDYDYDNMAGVPNFMIKCVVFTGLKNMESAAFYYTAKHGVNLMLGMVSGGEQRFVTQPGAIDWGKDTWFGSIYYGEKPDGNFLIARNESTVYTVMCVGIHFTDPEDIANIFARQLELAETYVPEIIQNE